MLVTSFGVVGANSKSISTPFSILLLCLFQRSTFTNQSPKQHSPISASPATSLFNSITKILQNPNLSLQYISDQIELTLQFNMGNFLFNYTLIRQLSQMFFAIFFFHGSEYLLAISIHGRSNVPLSSLLISKQYILAMVASLVEYLIEIVLFPQMKELWWLSNLGLGLVVIGEIIRKLAIITAGQSFTHLIRIHRDRQHQLITHGIYRIIRHPGYCGFFIWAVGIQIMLCNPICTAAFVVVLWRFFSDRILYEEYFLRQFFGPQYEEYARRVPSGVPFVK